MATEEERERVRRLFSLALRTSRRAPAGQPASISADEQLLISPLHGSENETGGGCGDPNHPCGWLNRAVAYEGERVASASDIQQACARLVEKLPASFRETVLEDAERLAATLMRLCPDSQWLTLAVEIIGKNCCSRWHQDRYEGRAIVTYTGPGTWMVDDEWVQFDQFDATIGAPKEVSDPRIVPCFDRVTKPPPNSAVLMKGSLWPGIRGVPGKEGLTHKAPNVPTDADGEVQFKRFMLKVDVATGRRPGI